MKRFSTITVLALPFVAAMSLPCEVACQETASEARIDELFSRYDNTRSPGCVVGVVRNGSLVFGRGYGMANLELRVPLTTKSVLRTGSVSKQFTAAAIALLAQEGALSLDDPIQTYLPEIPDYGSPITIRHLIHHSSGIRDYLVLMSLAGKRDDDWYTEEEVLAMLSRQEDLNFPPGQEFLYSNSGYFLLSQIVIRATGRTLREVAEEKIFHPLGMSHSRFQDTHRELAPNRASGYAPLEEGGFEISMTTLDMVGDGGVFTSIEDLASWIRNFRQPVVGGSDFLRTIHTRGVLNSGDTLPYAFGIRHGAYRGLRTVAHGGAFVGFRADITMFPDHNLGVATLCNVSTADPSGLSRRVAEVYLGGEMEPPPPPRERAREEEEPVFQMTAQELRAYSGSYYSPELDVVYTIDMSEDALSVRIGSTEPVPLTPREPDVFRAGYATLRFARDEAGMPGSFSVDAGRVRGITFVRR